MPFPRRQRGPLTHRQIQTIVYLLRDTDMSEQEIADTIGCTRICVSSINKAHNVRTNQRPPDPNPPFSSASM